ncbi:MAG TPA: CBS domain-containing protein [Planctomycetota bacterium]|nr:CBS domain-containing protein [Planctomycetota bacterium]
MRVQDICTRQVQSCVPGTNLAEAAKILWECDCGIVPVIDDQRKLVGVITDRDICMAVATRHKLASELRVGEVMSRDVRFCQPEDEVLDALHTMREAQIRRLPVVDGHRTLVGILSVSDAVLASRAAKGKSAAALTQEIMLTLMAIHEHRPENPIPPAEPGAVVLHR